MEDWRTNTITTKEGKEYTTYIAPDWHTNYFIDRFYNKTMEDIIRVLEEVHKRRPSDIGWKITDKEIYVYRNDHSNEKFHAPTETIVNDLVFDILRNGRPEPTEWTTGQKATADVWCT